MAEAEALQLGARLVRRRTRQGRARAQARAESARREVETLTFAELSEASSRAANGLRALGAKRGDRLLLMLGNTPALWIATLAAMKLGVV